MAELENKKQEDFEIIMTPSENDEDFITISNKEKWDRKIDSAINNYDPTNQIYSTYLNLGSSGNNTVTVELLNTLASNAQSSLSNILSINDIIRQYVNKDDIIGKTYETVESNVNTSFKLSYNDFSERRNKQKTLEKAKIIINNFNNSVNVKQLLRKAIPTTYSEGNYCIYLRENKGNYTVDYYPLGVAVVSDYDINGEPSLLINVTELVSKLRKVFLKDKKNKALYFDKIETEIKNNYPKEVYEAYVSKNQYAKLNIKYSGIIRTGNMNRKYGLSPIFRALKSALMLETFDNTDMVTSKAKAKKIIAQYLKSELMGQDGSREAYEQMAYAHENLMKAWKMPTVVVTPPVYVEKIEYIEPKAENTNIDTVNQYRSREMLALGITFLSPEKGQTVTTASIGVKELIKTIDKIAEQVADLINKWYRVILADNGIDIEYAPTISINSGQELEFEMRQSLATLLFNTFSTSRETCMDILGFDIDDEVQKRKQENENNLDEIFKPRLTNYTNSSDAKTTDNKNGRPSGGEDEDKQGYDKERNDSK